MKRIVAIALFGLSLMFTAMADGVKPRVAVFDPVITSGTIDPSMKSTIREIITSVVVNSGVYNTVERSLLEKVLQEQEFSNSGIVDDSNAIEIGKLTGANKVVVSLVSPAGGKSFLKGQKNMLSIKIIDVMTADIDKQRVKKVSANDFLDEVESLTIEVIHGSTEKEAKPVDEVQKQKEQNPKSKKTESEFVLHLDPGFEPDDPSHADNYIEVLLNGDVVGGGTISEGFDIRIKEKKHRKYKLEIRPTSISDKGKTDTRGKTKYDLDTSRQQRFDFLIQSRRDGKWTVYTVLRK